MRLGGYGLDVVRASDRLAQAEKCEALLEAARQRLAEARALEDEEAIWHEEETIEVLEYNLQMVLDRHVVPDREPYDPVDAVASGRNAGAVDFSTNLALLRMIEQSTRLERNQLEKRRLVIMRMKRNLRRWS